MSVKQKFPHIKNCDCVPKERVEKRRDNEKIVLLAMAALHCQGFDHEGRIRLYDKSMLSPFLQEALEKNAKRFPVWRNMELCPVCLAMVLRSEKKTQYCVHMPYKTLCHLCPRPCYTEKQMEEIRPMMRYSGPRLITKHPILTYRHMREIHRSKRLQKQHERGQVCSRSLP